MSHALGLPQSLPESDHAPRLPLLAAFVLTALAYYLSGRLGLLLAIPPGYATAVWPASGIALAAVMLRGYGMLPAIWLGSVAINGFSTAGAFDGSTPETILHSLTLPALIGLGAAAQAGIGGFLVRRLVGYRNLLEQELDVVKLLMLGGPLACLTSASTGVSTLFLRGLIPQESALFNWWTWWVGDTIGVLIFAPLVLIWAQRPFARYLRRQLQITLPLAALFAGVVWLFIFMSAREQARIQGDFDDWSRDIGLQMERAIDVRLDSLYALQGLYASSETVNAAEFRNFASRLLDRGDMRAMSWNPLVSNAQRAAFEQRMRSENGPRYAIHDYGSTPAVTAGVREQYVPVAYIVPEQENTDVFGYDALTDPQRGAAARRARDSGQPAATPPLRLLQDPGVNPGVLVFAPVYRNGAPTDTLERRRQNLVGFVVAVFQPQTLVPEARQVIGEGEPVELAISDVSDAAPVLLYRSRLFTEKPGLAGRKDITVGGRTWRLDFALTEQYLVSHRSWEVWTLLAAGMLFTGLLGMFLLVMLGRSTRVAQLVEERTAELQEVNRHLAREAARSERFETEARARADQIAATNRELEQFAFVVSHDLQAPLRNIQSFAKLLEKRHGATLADEAKEYLEYLRGSATDMGRLIDDLLQLSRVNPKRANMERTRAGDALNAALANLRTDIEARGATIEAADLPEVFGDASLLTQLFQNLIANAIKFQRADAPPKVRVDVELIRGEWRFAIADNGIGISEKNIGRLFQIFRRLHTAEEYPGTGIGLALCKKIVALHGGRIWLESKLGEGTTFFFALPLQAPSLPPVVESGPVL